MDNTNKATDKSTKIEVLSNKDSNSDIAGIIHDVVTQLTFLTGASFLLLIVYLRKKILSVVLTEGEKDYNREKDLYYSLISILAFSKSDRVLVYEFDDKKDLLKSPTLQVRSVGISEYNKSYDDKEENDLFYLLEHSDNNTIKSAVSEIKNEYIRGDLINNGVNYLITKLLTFDGDKIGILVIHYCKNGKEYFTTVELPNSDINLILLLTSLTKKHKSFISTLFKIFK